MPHEGPSPVQSSCFLLEPGGSLHAETTHTPPSLGPHGQTKGQGSPGSGWGARASASLSEMTSGPRGATAQLEALAFPDRTQALERAGYLSLEAMALPCCNLGAGSICYAAPVVGCRLSTGERRALTAIILPLVMDAMPVSRMDSDVSPVMTGPQARGVALGS